MTWLDFGRQRSKVKVTAGQRDASMSTLGRRSPASSFQLVSFEGVFMSHCEWMLCTCRFVRRWFRGRTTCARCDIEFRPHPQSALADKRDRTISKTPLKHSSAGQAAGTKDVRKPEPRPEEKVYK